MHDLMITERIRVLKEKIASEPRYVSIEQAQIITETYQANEDKPRILQRALSLQGALMRLSIRVEPEELIVGNRTAGVRSGVIFPEGGSAWVDREFETLPTRAQDPFEVRAEDRDYFNNSIKPYWEGKSLEDVIQRAYGGEIEKIAKVVKINQTDHAQGHICPNSRKWLAWGPEKIKKEAAKRLKDAVGEKKDFYESIVIVMAGAQHFMRRYGERLAGCEPRMQRVAENCMHLAVRPAETFHEAVQALWFLFVILHMESNGSSFSLGRMDQLLWKYYERDVNAGILCQQEALEIIECLFLKLNEIVYLRSASSAKYFAGFPIGFNIVIGGQDAQGKDCTNALSYLFLKAQAHLGLPQPNLSVRLHENTPTHFLKEAIRVVAKGSGMPQFFNDKAVIPALENLGVNSQDAMDYAVVGCVELTTQGNNLGWSDAAMFNLNKVLELALNGGKCLLTGEPLRADYGDLNTYSTFEALENVFQRYLDEYIELMVKACSVVEQAHIALLPTPFLSSVVNGCMEKGLDVTAGGAIYNFSGIQMIQIANLADSLAALKQLVFDEQRIDKRELLEALRCNFKGYEVLRARLLNKAPKYGNDVDWVDALGAKWATYFRSRLQRYTHYRGGKYHTGMYTVSAHVPMGENVGASPDGRYAKQPLADGGMSPMYGRDTSGPTAVLKSVSKLDKNLTSNGGLLNMKFLPSFFETERGVTQFAQLLRAFVALEIPHVQFNVVRPEDLLAARKNPEQYRSLTIRVAGYTAYFTELAGALQDEIIARTSYGSL